MLGSTLWRYGNQSCPQRRAHSTAPKTCVSGGNELQESQWAWSKCQEPDVKLVLLLWERQLLERSRVQQGLQGKNLPERPYQKSLLLLQPALVLLHLLLLSDQPLLHQVGRQHLPDAPQVQRGRVLDGAQTAQLLVGAGRDALPFLCMSFQKTKQNHKGCGKKASLSHCRGSALLEAACPKCTRIQEVYHRYAQLRLHDLLYGDNPRHTQREPRWSQNREVTGGVHKVDMYHQRCQGLCLPPGPHVRANSTPIRVLPSM